MDIKFDILDFIPRGHENAITRSVLKDLTGLPDRKVRDEISKSEEPIYNIGKGDGYFRYLDEKDLPFMRGYLKQENRRKEAIEDKVRKVRKQLNEIKGATWDKDGCFQSE